MKNFLLILSLFFISMSFGQEFKAKSIFLNNILESYKWNKRILLFIANESDVALIKEVNNFFITHKCKNEERNLELLKIIKDNTKHTIIPNYYENKKGIWLIGYDGYIKAYTKNGSLLSKLHNLIDNMPIRKEELEKIKSNC